jgi:hypothetical protein
VVTETNEDRRMAYKSFSSLSAITDGLIGQKLSVREAANFLRLSKSFLDKRRLDGAGPVYLKLGRRVVYDVKDLEVWAASARRQHTSEA